MKRSLICRCVAIAAVVLLLLIASSSHSFAQRDQNSVNKNVPLHEIVKLPGKLLAETKSSNADGNPQLTGYRVEEVTLPRPVTAEVRGQQVSVNRAWRVTVTGGPFPVRAMPAVIWIDDRVVGYGIENESLSQITAITFDDSLLTNGGVVSLSYGEDKHGRVRIPEKLQLNRGGQSK
jgi:hypothetical protein